MPADRRIDSLLRRAQDAIARRHLDDAEKIYGAVIEIDPDHTAALTFLASRMLESGRAAAALAHYKRLTTLHAADPILLTGLGRAYFEGGNPAEAKRAFIEALSLAPSAFIARFRLAQAYMQLGDHYLALVHFYRAIGDAQRQGRWLNDATTHPTLRRAVRAAMTFVDQGRFRMYSEILDALRQEFGADQLTRVDKALRIYLHLQPPDYSDQRQQPAFLFFPDLPTLPYIEKAAMPWLEELEAGASAVRQEMLEVHDAHCGFEPFLRFHDEKEARAYLRGDRGPGNWNAYFFYRHGEHYVENASRCPETSALLNCLPLLKIPKHGPEICFSVLTAGSHILPHRGVTNTRVVVHLPLLIPENAALVVGGEKHVWKFGQAVAFDDTFEHEAWNRSAQNRVILLMDAWNPYLTEVERIALQRLVVAIEEFAEAAGQPLTLS